MIMNCQCRFISCKKGTTLVGDVDNVGGCACKIKSEQIKEGDQGSLCQQGLVIFQSA